MNIGEYYDTVMACSIGGYLKLSTLKGYFPLGTAQSEITF